MSFSNYSSLGWHLFSLRIYRTSTQDLLDFIVSVEKWGAIDRSAFIGYFNLSLIAFNFFSLLCAIVVQCCDYGCDSKNLHVMFRIHRSDENKWRGGKGENESPFGIAGCSE